MSRGPRASRSSTRSDPPPTGTGRAGGGRSAPPARQVDDAFGDEFPGADPLSTECYVNLCHAGERMLALLDRHGRATFDLSIPALSVLAIIEGADEPLTPTTIAERAIVTAASITSLLDTLERRGLVRRQRHPDDRRKVLVEITPDGLAVVDEFLPAARGIEMAVMGGLGEQDRRRLLRTLTKVQQAIAAIEAGEIVPEVYQRRR